MTVPEEVEYGTSIECKKAYSVPFLIGRRNLVAVSNDLAASETSAQQNVVTIFGSLDSTGWLGNMASHVWNRQDWICLGDDKLEQLPFLPWLWQRHTASTSLYNSIPMPSLSTLNSTKITWPTFLNNSVVLRQFHPLGYSTFLSSSLHPL
jgi:hypothetical protein